MLRKIGSLLWPLLHEETHPKTFIKFGGRQNLLQKRCIKAYNISDYDEVVTVTNGVNIIPRNYLVSSGMPPSRNSSLFYDQVFNVTKEC